MDGWGLEHQQGNVMSYIIVYTTNRSVAKTLYNLENGRKSKKKGREGKME